MNSGNGVYNTGRLDNAHAPLSYTGLRKLNLGADGGYYSLSPSGRMWVPTPNIVRESA